MFGMLESLRYIEIAYALWHVMHITSSPPPPPPLLAVAFQSVNDGSVASRFKGYVQSHCTNVNVAT